MEIFRSPKMSEVIRAGKRRIMIYLSFSTTNSPRFPFFTLFMTCSVVFVFVFPLHLPIWSYYWPSSKSCSIFMRLIHLFRSSFSHSSLFYDTLWHFLIHSMIKYDEASSHSYSSMHLFVHIPDFRSVIKSFPHFLTKFHFLFLWTIERIPFEIRNSSNLPKREWMGLKIEVSEKSRISGKHSSSLE